jgi:hypothetical protein
MNQALEILLAGVVDYAGLFPPAALDMTAAVQSYARYLDDPDRRLLGRFVVPVVRLREFDEAARELLPRGETAAPWRLSALPGPDVTADIDLALKFNDRHGSDSGLGRAVIDAFEIKASVPDQILAAASMMPRRIAAFFEVPIANDPRQFIDAIRQTGTFAKARTGGVTANAFPEARDVARFMVRCRDARVAFKLTAGLHHPLRAEYRLTYADDAPCGTMFGYLNMFVGAALAWHGAGEDVVAAALLATSIHDFHFDDDSLDFRGHSVPVSTLRDARANFITSFGSCSFREPVDDLAALSIA